MVKECIQLLMVLLLFSIILSIFGHAEFSCSFYNYSYKELCLGL